MAVGADGNNKILARFRLDQPTVNRLRSYAAVQRRSVDSVLEDIIVSVIGKPRVDDVNDEEEEDE